MWINKENAHITNQKKPDFIEVKHRGDWRDRRFIEKIIRFRLLKEYTGIGVEIKIDKLPIEKSEYSRFIYIYWKDIIEDYYKNIGCNINDDFISNLYSMDDLRMLISKLKIQIIISTLFIIPNSLKIR
jgi:hypothetical protein